MSTHQKDGAITSRVYSRIGLLGNPSDGFQGACLSLSLANFWAEVSCMGRTGRNPPASVCIANGSELLGTSGGRLVG